MVVEKILQKFPDLTKYDVRSTSMGDTGADLKLSEIARKLFPFSCECKNHAKFAVYKDFEQAQSNADGLTPILVIKQNNSQPLVIMTLEDWFARIKTNQD